MALKPSKVFVIAMLCSVSSLLASESINAQSEELEMEKQLNECVSDIPRIEAECRLQTAENSLNNQLKGI